MVLALCLDTVYICHRRMRSFRAIISKVWDQFQVILLSIWYVPVGVITYMTLAHAHFIEESK